MEVSPASLLVLQQDSCHSEQHLVEEVDLDDMVGGVPREADQDHH